MATAPAILHNAPNHKIRNRAKHMFLKKIITSGFKSFADRITITLDKTHITGIVGPNGSGKSNVIDAVRWVMGEQNTKMLRGEKATDIIFAGSEKRKPLGMAEVSLVFDNEEASVFCPPEYRHEPEITLTRRLYIDGQREYLINRKPVRLKDIVSFFTSTGLGGRSYSMIQQGQVDRILQAKPEQLREMLEEAAGTLIFKTRRMEANKKLERTAQNMARIDDILGELERQIQTLKAQVEKAEEWQNLTAEMRERETELFVYNFRHFNKKKSELQKDIEDNSLKKVACLGEIARLEVRHEELKKFLDEADPELHALTEEITLLREKLAASEASLINSRQLLESGEEQVRELSAELDEEEQNLQKIKAEAGEAESRLEAAQREWEDLEESLEDLVSRSEIADEEDQVYQSRIEEMKEERRNIERLLENHKMRRENLEKEYSKASRIMNEQTEKVLALEEELSHEQIIFEGQQLKLASEKKGLGKETEKRGELEQKQQKVQDRIKESRKQLDKSKSGWFEQKARLKSLEEREQDADGWVAQIRELKEAEGETESRMWVMFSELIRLGADFHSLPEAVRLSFQSWSERLIVNDREHLRLVTKECAEQKIGGVPVSVLKRDEIPSDFAKLADQWQLAPIGRFLETEQQNPGLKQLFSSLWYQTSSGIPGHQLLSQLPSGVMIFTQDGLCIQSEYDGVIGAPSGEEGSLARKDKIAELSRLVEALDEEQQRWTDKITQQEDESKKLQTDIKALEDEISEKNKSLLELMSEFKVREQKIQHKQDQIVEVRQQYRELEENCERYGTEVEDLKRSKEALTTEKTQIDETLEDALAQCDEIKDRQGELKRQVEQQKIELASAKTLSQTLREHFDRDRGKEEQIQSRVLKKQDNLEQLKIRIQESGQMQQDLTEEIEKYVYQREELEVSLNKKKEANSEIVDELRQTETRLKEAREIQQKAQKHLSDHELELERIRLGIEGIKQQSLEKYQFDPEASDLEDQPDFSPENASKAVSKIRGKLDGFGPVNMMAVEEYRELNVRKEFMETQKTEVLSSISLLELAIDEIEETSKNRFIQTFTTLNEEFSSLFPVLFPRGEGQIQMTDPDNSLESGVEIMVRLPGKKRQNMRLFSGGEKALTAIALIFALLKSKPTPFCFLDEVDAPLDETNVGRYNNVLEALADRFQFIVITHRRKTMEVLDTLYGVTMQEPGVSKVVGVDMSKAIPTHLQKSFKEEKRKGASAAP